MTGIHAALTAAIDGAEAEARGVLALFEHPIWPAQKHEVVRAERDLRGLAEDRDILARHYQGSDEGGFPTCVECDCADFECWYLLGLARRHGIEVEP